MKIKNKAFTLIELLVVIVIIGILATISVSTFTGFYSKAEDSKRFSIVENIAKIVNLEALYKSPNKYDYSVAGSLKSALDKHGYDSYEESKNICYFLIWDNLSETFAVLTWGETSSTKDFQSPGIIVSGTPEAVESYKNNTFMNDASFLTCRNAVINGSNAYIDNVYNQFPEPHIPGFPYIVIGRNGQILHTTF